MQQMAAQGSSHQHQQYHTSSGVLPSTFSSSGPQQNIGQTNSRSGSSNSKKRVSSATRRKDSIGASTGNAQSNNYFEVKQLYQNAAKQVTHQQQHHQ